MIGPIWQRSARARQVRWPVHRRCSGSMTVLNGNLDAALRQSAQVAESTIRCSHSTIGIVTEIWGRVRADCRYVFEHPYNLRTPAFATRGSLTKGRVGWNIVTSYLNSGLFFCTPYGQDSTSQNTTIAMISPRNISRFATSFEGSLGRRLQSSRPRDRPLYHRRKFIRSPAGTHFTFRHSLSEPSPHKDAPCGTGSASSVGKDFAAPSRMHLRKPLLKSRAQALVAKVREGREHRDRPQSRGCSPSPPNGHHGRKRPPKRRRNRRYRKDVLYEGEVTLVSEGTV